MSFIWGLYLMKLGAVGEACSPIFCVLSSALMTELINITGAEKQKKHLEALCTGKGQSGTVLRVVLL